MKRILTFTIILIMLTSCTPLQTQAELHGVLNRVSNLGLVLISVNMILEKDGTDKRMQPHEDEDNS